MTHDHICFFMKEAAKLSAAHNLTAAYHHCQQLAAQHYENFPTASQLIRADLRPAVAAIYAFARHADDIADNAQIPISVREKELDAWDTLLERCTEGSVEHPIMLALGDTLRRHQLPVELLHDLLVAFRMDLTIHRYASTEDLHYYCHYSANPIGRLMLALHGINDPAALAQSDAICTGLQLANFWQDLSRDLPDGRSYLALEWLTPQHLDHEALLEGRAADEPLRAALQTAIHHTHGLFDRGAPLLSALPWRLRAQIAATLAGGRAILRAVARNPDPLRQRPDLQRSDWLRLAPGIVRNTLFPPHS
ncbi:MAG: squalene synthase HpnC [Mariprofundales bacterium]|nr:squalene synthase HpnC [Mariprofundales bacterium]